MLLLAGFFSFIKCEYIELTTSNAYDYIGGRKPVFVKFYLPTCGHCKAMAPAFDEAATYFTDVTFAGVDCNVEHELCFRYNASRYPTLFLFLAQEEEGIDFNGARTSDGFCDFIEEHTHLKSTRPPNYMIELHPLNFEETVNHTKCVFVTFYAPWCAHCKKFLPEAKIAATAFLPDANVTVAAVNCDLYKEFCEPIAKGFPTIRLYKDTVNMSFNRGRTAEDVMKFVNQKCGTERGVNGLLNDEAGLIPQASTLVQQFINATDKESFLPRLKRIPGASFYVTVMERYLQKGEAQLKKDMATMTGILDSRKGSWASLDGMKKRLNVFAEFFPKPPTPTPTARPRLPPHPRKGPGGGPEL